VADVAAMTGISRNTVSRQFERERGIIVLAHPKTMHKRR
jgi:DNA-binding LacI/PurR family transcriptional regulator